MEQTAHLLKVKFNMVLPLEKDTYNEKGYFLLSFIKIKFTIDLTVYSLIIEFLSSNDIIYELEITSENNSKKIFSNEDSNKISDAKDIFNKYNIPYLSTLDCSHTEFICLPINDKLNSSKEDINSLILEKYQGCIQEGIKEYSCFDYDFIEEIQKEIHQIVIQNIKSMLI